MATAPPAVRRRQALKTRAAEVPSSQTPAPSAAAPRQTLSRSAPPTRLLPPPWQLLILLCSKAAQLQGRHRPLQPKPPSMVKRPLTQQPRPRGAHRSSPMKSALPRRPRPPHRPRMWARHWLWSRVSSLLQLLQRRTSGLAMMPRLRMDLHRVSPFQVPMPIWA